ncbi:MAG TPA: hypothetical protein VFQ53_36165 [Kofleriaceae bacterium]|nr:hypothetical protein [Kofleriaceae bacterium]
MLRPGVPFTGIKIFSATMVAEREALGTRITEWMAKNPNLEVTEICVTQSSDSSFHCVTFTVFYRERP